MLPIVDKLIAEGFKIEKREVWHNQDYGKELAKMDGGKCGGVPFFINTDSGEWICGATIEKRMRQLVRGEKIEI
jgi:hypothetical protein